MAKHSAFFTNILRLLCLCLITELNVTAQKTDSKDGTFSDSISLDKTSLKNAFKPLLMKFPDKTRTQEEAEDYMNALSDKLSAAAQKDNNIQMTGESCARGLGHLYKV